MEIFVEILPPNQLDARQGPARAAAWSSGLSAAQSHTMVASVFRTSLSDKEDPQPYQLSLQSSLHQPSIIPSLKGSCFLWVPPSPDLEEGLQAHSPHPSGHISEESLFHSPGVIIRVTSRVFILVLRI